MGLKVLNIIVLLFATKALALTAPGPAIIELPIANSTVEVRFTNPNCAEHLYASPVLAQNGQELLGKKKGAYCDYSDYANAQSWVHSPQTKLIDWINSRETLEVFFAYLSGSNKPVLAALCENIKSRGLKVTYVLDSTSDLSLVNQYLHNLDCTVDSPVEDLPVVNRLVRGHSGTDDGQGDPLQSDFIGYAHNKIFVINPNHPDRLKFAVSSGNLSSGVVMHHENWLFFDVIKDSYLAQSHLCLVQLQLDDSAHVNKYVYADRNDECLKKVLKNHRPEREGIIPFFVPGEGDTAIRKYIEPALNSAQRITLAAHRFGLGRLVNGLRRSASQGRKVRMIFDDDIYWLMQGSQVGDNMPFEAANVKSILNSGTAEVKYMETNNASHLLHHNKILLFEGMSGKPDAVWTGAGNFTGAAFYTNFENYYYITVPAVVDHYRKQLDYMWDELATPFEKMPVEDVPTVGGN